MKKYIKCDLCNSEENIVIEAMGRHRELVTSVCCCKCGLVYQNPRMTSEEIKEFYNSNYAKEIYEGEVTEEWRTLVDKQRYTYIQTNMHTDKTRVLNILEIGSGYGGLLELFRQDGHVVKGIEPSRSLYEISKKKNLDIFNGFFEDFTDSVKYDLIFASHVIEHVESPRMFMQKARELLKNEGEIIIETPNIWYLTGDPHTGDGYALTKEHTFTFSEKTLSLLAQVTEFTIEFLPKIALENLYAIFSPSPPLKQIEIDKCKDNFIDIANHVFDYRANYNWKQKLFKNKRLVGIHLFVKRLTGERGLVFIKMFIKKIGLSKVIRKMRFQIH